MSQLKPPYKYFGGKSRVTNIIWKGFGNIDNYIEPFAGSLAVLLANPNIPKMETINDIDHFIVNFWRAVSSDPDGVAKFADYPITEADLHARHRWLVSQSTTDFSNKITLDPDFYDLKIAGWWIWGICASIGSNWLQNKGLNALPLLAGAGSGIHLSKSITDLFKDLQQRTRKVRIACGDWKRIITPSITYKNKSLKKEDITGVFLDPPYDFKNRDKVYRQENNVFKEVCEWAVQHGNDPKMRVIVCGYEGSFDFPSDWQVYSWKSNGMSNLGDSRGKDNSLKERIYFSPHCLPVI
jgi:DNA adenine methylase